MAARRKTDSEADLRRATVAAIEAGLAEVAPGIEVLDRDVRVGGSELDLVAVGPGGRLALILIVDSEGELARVVDAALLGREDAELLGRHLGRSCSPEPALVLVVAPRFTEAALARFGLLGGVDLFAFELRELSSATRSRVYLAPRAIAHGVSVSEARDPVEEWVGNLSGSLSVLVRTLAERLGRLDDEIVCAVDGDGSESMLVWTLGERIVCELRVDQHDLWAELPDDPGDTTSRIRAVADIEELVERIVDRHVAFLTSEPLHPSSPALDESFVIPGPVEILTPEELQAFRE